jgi:hypothetical protein
MEDEKEEESWVFAMHRDDKRHFFRHNNKTSPFALFLRRNTHHTIATACKE